MAVMGDKLELLTLNQGGPVVSGSRLNCDFHSTECRGERVLSRACAGDCCLCV